MDIPLGRHLSLWEFCTCTNTFRRFGAAIDPLPSAPETLQALQDLAVHLLDPLIDHYGRDRFELTYGFCSDDLRRHLLMKDEAGVRFGRIGPEVDQHMSHDVNPRTGRPFCRNPGASCDFRIRGVPSSEVVDWLVSQHLPFDSLYYYGPDRPLHLSHGPLHRRAIWAFTPKNVPTKKGVEQWQAPASGDRPGRT